MAISECPSCTYHIQVESNLQEGDAVSCPDCGAKLRMVKNFPPVFELIEKE